MSRSTGAQRVIVHGVAPDSGNLGLNALCTSLVTGLRAIAPATEMSVLTFGRGIQPAPRENMEYVGAYSTKRIHRPESLWNIRMSAHFGGLNNRAARRILGASAFLDASGGDSFTDLYGQQRFRAMVLPKQIALENNIPLIFLPQTYGPFESSRSRAIATRLVREAHGAWARDQRNYETLREMLGDSFDPARHRAGVDLAFALEAREPSEQALGAAANMLLYRDGTPLVGLNVSGLLYNDPAPAAERYGLRAAYREVISQTAHAILNNSAARLLLVPHVMPSAGGNDNDLSACAEVCKELRDVFGDRVDALPSGLDERETKWCIGKTDWFCGTRMHSAIAAMGSGVPTSAIAYSKKTIGVFETCGLGDQVADPRTLGTGEMVERLVASFEARSLVKARLAQHIPGVREQARAQVVDIAKLAGLDGAYASVARAA